ncbi:MAG: hypothetical protein R2854_02890 [Caldilineaceae bacterium]
MGDIPSSGSGLGSSSTVTVGLLNAMFTYLGETKDAATLARLACHVEIDVLGKPIGVQDQYIITFGGQRFIHFCRDGGVRVESLGLDDEQTRRLNRNLMLFLLAASPARREDTFWASRHTTSGRPPMRCAALKRLALQVRGALHAGAFDDFGPAAG